ncbi:MULTISPECIES: hypothetical protein [Acinetobacter]|uniref:Uncharacterized protein n=1 Tax=Acinetobacter baumannii TaxID=470 RepID=A0AA36YLM9_ACIBA|nr:MULTISPECIES: hypothetical protein [Acinetobacter]EHU1442013.1 hypothetical protein [Acinetobacter baumannii]EHU1771968.1 hypothetical protein [Acinetobacter baumannii]EHU1810543.1 hypothetical protein [Acinetobacter baumannii]EHU1977121.1 hypothetical protein [Acinetobacter baumannii]EHU2095276.1 hypothetical protein [Acinetobacter baumannii]
MSEFKVGDKVVFLSNKSDDTEIYTVEAVLDDGRFLGINDYRQAFSSIKFKRAEPEEIAAGHRIDNDLGDDSHIENHISPNCKTIGEQS